MLFNGANQTILVHIFTANVPIVLIGQLRNSTAGQPIRPGPACPGVDVGGGGVPPGIVVERTELTTISKNFKDQKVVKKIEEGEYQGNKKKVRPLKKKLKKTFVSASSGTDGTLSYRADFDHAEADPDQS